MFNNTSLQGNTNKRNTMNYHLSAVRRAIITNTKDWFWQRQNATFAHYWLECKLVCVKQYGASFKKLYSELHSDPIPHYWMYSPRK